MSPGWKSAVEKILFWEMVLLGAELSACLGGEMQGCSEPTNLLGCCMPTENLPALSISGPSLGMLMQLACPHWGKALSSVSPFPH